MSRTGKYSIRMGRNGDIGDVLPREASEQLFDDLNERSERIRVTLKVIGENLKTAGPTVRKQLIVRKGELETQLTHLRFDRQKAYLPRYAEAFLSVARAVLDETALFRIDKLVVEKVGVPPRDWQRFLGDNGYGKVDTGTYKG